MLLHIVIFYLAICYAFLQILLLCGCVRLSFTYAFFSPRVHHPSFAFGVCCFSLAAFADPFLGGGVM